MGTRFGWLAVLASVLLAADTFGQWHCSIRYQYDNAGNRTHRDWYCWSGGPWDFGGGDTTNTDDERMAMEGPLAANTVMAVPSPADDQVSVILKDAVESGMLEIWDARGQVVLTERMAGNQLTLATGALSNGAYFACVIVGNEMLKVSFTVQHR